MGVSIPIQKPIARISSRLIGGFFITSLAVATVISRLPYQSAILNNSDAATYALALEQFNAHLAQPQMAGYPAYILIGWAFNLIFHDPLRSLVWVSMLFSGLSVAMIYLAGREIFNARAGFLASLLVSTSTVFWYFGEIAGPYTVDFFASIIVGWMCYRVLRSKGNGSLLAAAITVGLAGAFHLQVLIVLFPLFFFSMRYRSLWAILAGSAIAGLVFTAFFVPAVYLSGGPVPLLNSMINSVPALDDTGTWVEATRLARLGENVRSIIVHAVHSLGEILIPFLLIGLLAQRRRRIQAPNNRLVFLMLWFIPAWIIFLMIRPGNLGAIQVSLPPFFLLAAAGIDRLMQRGRLALAAGMSIVVFVLTWQAAVFALLPEAPFGTAYRGFENFALLQSQQSYHQSRLALISELPVEGTIVYADQFRHMQYYLPQYRTFTYPRFERNNPHLVKLMISLQDGRMEAWKDVDVSNLVPSAVKRVVLYDWPAGLTISEQIQVQELTLNGHSVHVIVVPDGQRIEWTEAGLSLRPVNGGYLITLAPAVGVANGSGE